MAQYPVVKIVRERDRVGRKHQSSCALNSVLAAAPLRFTNEPVTVFAVILAFLFNAFELENMPTSNAVPMVGRSTGGALSDSPLLLLE